MTSSSILITGGSEGLGLELAKLAIGKGLTTHICGSSEEKLKNAKKTVNSDLLITHTCDVSNAEQVEKMVSEIPELDILINNAGVWSDGVFEEQSVEEISRLININLTGLMFVSKFAIPKLLKSENPFLFNISSTSGLSGRKNSEIYCASKWGVTGFTESLKDRFLESKMKVIGIYPGGMKTALFEKAGSNKDLTNWMNPADVAKIVMDVLDQPANVMTGHVVINKKVY